MTAWNHEAQILRTILRNRLAMDGPTDAIAADIRELEHAMWEQFDRAQDKRNRAACASPDAAQKCHACGCWKAVA